jgi:hypothetical protein
MAASFAAIGKALDAGDTAAAQSAWSQMQTQLESLGSSQGQGGPLQQDMAKLGQLLDSGDLDGAKSLYQSMQSRMQAHGHRHHHQTAQDSSAGSSSTSSTGSATPSAAGGFRSDFEALGAALASGDLAGAKSAWSTLQTDFQNRTQKASD